MIWTFKDIEASGEYKNDMNRELDRAETGGVHVYMLHLPVELHRAAAAAARDAGMSLKRWIMQTITPELVEGGYLRSKQEGQS